jgi:hypothetical protein
MALNDPIGSETRSELADWVELSSIVAPTGSTGTAELRRLLAREQEQEHERTTDPDTGEVLEEETLETAATTVEDAVVQELQYRAEILGESYPFELVGGSTSWRLVYRGREGDGRAIYLACLFISGMRDGRLKQAALQEETGVDPARLFQAISTVAASQYLGDGVSFGWPRPDGSDFRDALNAFTAAVGVGGAKAIPPLASARREKDEGIDVIAWRSFPDRRPGHLILFGQVASGGNWKGKPVSSELGTFMDWFHTRPTDHPIEGMFIPFPQHHECAPLIGVDWDRAVVDYCRRNEIKYGLIFDRLRLTVLAGAMPPPPDTDAWIDGSIVVAARAGE